jgi:hypothetical protein
MILKKAGGRFQIEGVPRILVSISVRLNILSESGLAGSKNSCKEQVRKARYALRSVK